MLHQWFTCVHLLDTYLANLTEDFQLSFTTHQFPSEQHKVVCNQHLHAECSGSATISLEVRQKSIKYSQYLTSFCLRTHILLQRLILNVVKTYAAMVIYEVFESLRLPLAKGSSTSNQAFLLRRKDVTALLGARNRYALRLADHQRSTPHCAGWDRLIQRKEQTLS